MTECPGSRLQGMERHDAAHVEARLIIPWGQGPLRVDVVHVCGQADCPQRLVEWAEPARDAKGILRKLLGPRGMLHDEPPKPPLVVAPEVAHDEEYLPCRNGVCGHVQSPGHPAYPHGPARGGGLP